MGEPAQLNPLLEARDVWVTPPGAEEPSVRGVSLRLEEGEWVALTGPNGSGKSSLALALAGLWPCGRGSILTHGAPLEPSAEGRARAKVAVVLQEPAVQLFEPTVADELAFTPRNLGLDEPEVERRVSDLATRLGLSGELASDPRTLSAGRQQVVLIAAALAARPRVVVVDEGAAHLDSAARAMVVALMRSETAGGLGLLWVTQDRGEMTAADRVVDMGAIESGGRRTRRLDPSEGVRPPPSSAGPEGPRARVTVVPGGCPTGPRIQTGREIRLTLAPARPIAFTGPNGCGKSVALEALAGAIATPQLRVEWVGNPGQPPVIASQYPESQTFAETVSEEIGYGHLHRLGRPIGADVTSELLAALGFDPDWARRSPWALSAGERRLVQALAALATPASLYLLDEPTCGLDPDRAARLTRLISRTAARSAVAVGTQDEALVRELGADQTRFGE